MPRGAGLRWGEGVVAGAESFLVAPGCFHQSRLVFSGPACLARARAASIASSGSLLPRFWLHNRWASRTLLRSVGEPPRLIGNISSTSGDCGSP